MVNKAHRGLNGAKSVELFRLSGEGRLRRWAVLSALGLCSFASVGVAGQARAAGAPPVFGTPAWFAAKAAAQPASSSAPSSGSGSAITTPGQAQTQAAQSMADLNAALAAISANVTAQQNAVAAAQINLNSSASSVPNGLVPGGLVPQSQSTWIGIAKGNQGLSSSTNASTGQVTVNVTQNAADAILTWNSFNVGKNTTLDFNQSAGTQTNGSNDWVALNRVIGDVNGAQILGKINAQGDVYIIDQNGIMFGSGSQVNTHSLIATSLALFNSNPDPTTANNQFQSGGILSTAGVLGAGLLVPNASGATGNITIQAGASITTGEAGFSLIAAPQVSNAGTITATDGQIILAATTGLGLSLPPSGSSSDQLLPYLAISGSGNSNLLVNTGIIQSIRGNVTLLGLNIEQEGVVGATTSVTQGGSITISAENQEGNQAGAITFTSGSVTTILPDEDGETTTSTSSATSAFNQVQPQVDITGGSVQFQGGAAVQNGSLITVIPGALLEAPGASVNIAAASLDTAYVADPNFASQPGRVYIEGVLTQEVDGKPVTLPGSIIDVAGIAGTELPVSDTMVTVGPITANDLADSPLLQDGFLIGQTVVVDSTQAGTRADGTPWVGSPILDAEGYVQGIPRTIDQLLVNGGTISLSGAEVITKAGSLLNLDGGYINYQGGMVDGPTNLLAADGQIYSISNANPDLQYVGFAGQFSTTSARWNVTSTWTDPLLSGSIAQYEPGFVQGGNAGTLNIAVTNGSTAGVSQGVAILDGIITAQAVAGRNQVTSGSVPAGGTFNIGDIGYNGSGQQTGPYGPSYFITDQNLNLREDFAANTQLSSALPTLTNPATSAAAPVDEADPNSGVFSLLNWTPINGNALATAGFSSININAPQGQIVVPTGTSLTAQPYLFSSGSGQYNISLNAALITIDGDLTARGGTINVQSTGLELGPTFASVNPGGIVVGQGALLDASGKFVNDSGLGPDQISGSEFINGGTIALLTDQTSFAGLDTTGSIAVYGTLNVSSGAYVGTNGQVAMNGDVPEGRAGTIELETYVSYPAFYGQSGSPYLVPTSLPSTGTITLGTPGDCGVTTSGCAELLGYGFSQGGTLDLQALGFMIGNGTQAPSGTKPWDLYLPASFFSGQGGFGNGKALGFGNYVLNAEYDATIASGTQISLTQPNLLANYNNLTLAPTGSDVLSAGLTSVGTVDAYQRNGLGPTNLSITAGDFLNWNAGVTGDTINSRGLSLLSQYSSQGITGTVLLGAGAAIVADPGANILLGSPNAVEVLGSITDHGGIITLDGKSATQFDSPSLPGTLDSIPGQSVVLGADSVLDVSGTALYNPDVQPVQVAGQVVLPATGTVLNGGSVDIYSANITAQGASGAMPGAVIDIAGAGAGTQKIIFDVPQSNGSYAPEQEWSNAGSVVLGAGSSLNFNGSIQAQGGSGLLADGSVGQGEGGTLSLYALDSASTVILASNGEAPAATPAAGTLYFQAGKLGSWGISSFNIGSDISPDSKQPETPLYISPLTIGFAGDFNLSLSQSFTADAVNYVALAAGANTVSQFAPPSATTVTIAAPYVALNGYYNTSENSGTPAAPVAGPSTLTVNANFIDLGGAFQINNFANVNLDSTPLPGSTGAFAGTGGDIRFVTPEGFDFLDNTNVPQRGELLTTANLSFTATELYPATYNSFVIEANTIDVEQAAGSTPSVPLSAGGSLLFDATTITQNGTIWAPSGSIILGYGGTSDTATAALFNPTTEFYSASGTTQSTINQLTLTPTTNVTLGSGSTTSVSLDGAVIPFGTTVDGQEWQYNFTIPGNGTLADLTQPPPKLIEIQGANVNLQSGADVDLSGGGELQAVEWVPGTGGTRNVLSQYNTSYATSSSGTQVPLYPDARGIYALVPSYEVPVAAYDAVFSQGQAAIGVGQAVQLSAAPGVAAGTYVLMPAMYATLPGALRIVQDTGTVDSLASANSVAPDGTMFVAGNFVNALDGTQGSRTTTFEVQSAAVWGKYSDYTRTSADSFFSNLAVQSGTATPQLPEDAGQLVLGASSSLSLGASINTAAAASGGAKAEIDIASNDIDIVSSLPSTTDSGTLYLTVNELNNLDAGSLLIGGTRTQTSSGVTIDPVASTLVVDDQANTGTSTSPSINNADVLSAPEIILVTQGAGTTQGSGSLTVKSGSVITATAQSTPGLGTPITVDGNGTLLMVSSNQPAAFTRTGTSDLSSLAIGDNAVVSGNVVILDSTGSNTLSPNATLTATNLTADAGSIIFDSSGAALNGVNGFVIGSQTLEQFANATNITLRSYGDIDFEGPTTVALSGTTGTLALSAGDFTDGLYGTTPGLVKLSAPTLILSNDNDPSSAATANNTGSATLDLNGNEIDFGTAGSGSTSTAWISGFGTVNANATGGIVGQANVFDFGGANVNFSAPIILAGTNSTTALRNINALALASASGTALSGAGDLGGQISFVADSISDNAVIQAAGGNLSLEAKTGKLVIGSGASLNVAGVAEQFYDIYEYAPGGNISLTADQGLVQIASGAQLNFSGAQPAVGNTGGSNAGSLSISAPTVPSDPTADSVTIQGTLSGTAPQGYTGGSFSLDAGRVGDLSNIVTSLSNSTGVSSVTGSISIETQTGNLSLASTQTLGANSVMLIADAGSVAVDGTIDANSVSGPGGSISLYGATGVDVEGTLNASTASTTQRGGTIQIGVSGTPDGTLNTTYGYENVDAAGSGTITIGSQAFINASGGDDGSGHVGGTVDLRAPLLSDGDINLQVANGARIDVANINSDAGRNGVPAAGSVTLEAYAVWSTADTQNKGTSLYFDGVIDPAGWYNSNGTLVAGTLTNQNGYVVGNVVSGTMTSVPAGDFFTPTNPYAAHAGFYTQTLAGFVENPGFSSDFQNRVSALNAAISGGNATQTSVAPGIELDNPVSSTSSGTITVGSNWNLAACNNGCSSPSDFLYRYQGNAPILTIRAGGDLDIDASISDGFTQAAGTVPQLTYSAAAYLAAGGYYTEYRGTLSGLFPSTIIYDGASYSLASNPNYSGDAPPAGYPGSTGTQSAQYYTNYDAWQHTEEGIAATVSKLVNTSYTVSPGTFAPGAPSLSGEPSYAAYAAAYLVYVGKLTATGGTPQPPTLPPDSSDYSSTGSTSYLSLWTKYESTVVALDGIKFGTPTSVSFYIYPPLPPTAATSSVYATAGDGNAAANVPTLQDVAPLQYATLSGGNSSSYRLVAGAQFNTEDGIITTTADPLALAPNAASGNIVIGGYTQVANENLTFTGSPTAGVNGTNPLLDLPTEVRTGTGFIDIAAAQDFDLVDSNKSDATYNVAAPGVVYTAGVTTTQNTTVCILTCGSTNGSSLVTISNGTPVAPELIVSGAVNPDDAGDISIHAGGDINSYENVVDSTGSITGVAGQFVGQFWTAWMESGNVFQTSSTGAQVMVASSINYGAFDQGILSAGGNVSVSAGGNISSLAVSLPTTWYLGDNNSTVNTVGAGNLNVTAGGNIYSGDYFVARGQGTINAGGYIGLPVSTSDPDYVTISYNFGSATVSSPASTLLALQDAQLQVNSRQSADIGGVYDPSYLEYGNTTFDSQGYSQTSALTVTATAGDVTFNTLHNAAELFAGGNLVGETTDAGAFILPASLNLTALSGGITVEDGGALAPAGVSDSLIGTKNDCLALSDCTYGQLNLIARNSINLYAADPGALTDLAMIDTDPATMPSPLNPVAQGFTLPLSLIPNDSNSNYSDHESVPLHAGDPTPVRVYSLDGSIVDGQPGSAGFYLYPVTVTPDKEALIYAAQDIVDLNFLGQNINDSDVTRIVAGQDIYDTPLPNRFGLNGASVESLQLSGPGTFDVEAGRNIGPLTNQNEAVADGGYSTTNGTGIDTVGNTYDPYLPRQSAAINVLFGIAPGVDLQDFINTYIAPGASVSGVPSFAPELLSFMEQYESGLSYKYSDGSLSDQQTNARTLTQAQAWTMFQALPSYVQQLFVVQVFNSILTLTGQDYNAVGSPYYHQYARGYQAINPLFPASYGYTANNLGGGTNGANAPVTTGDLDIRGSTIQTQQGGDINILGPGGSITLASASAPPYLVSSSGQVLAGPNTEGILTLEQGNINIFADESVLLAQSRIFTEQGGNLLIWTSNGDINAGEGTKTTAYVPPLDYQCDLDHYCIINPAGEVTGAGIATLQTVAGAPPGDVELVAPRGTVDAGAAGIRVSGNLVIAALAVANAFNIQVKGSEVGVPTAARVDTSALSAASSASAAAEEAGALTNRGNQDAGSMITVEVVGFGSPDDEQKKKLRKQSKEGT